MQEDSRILKQRAALGNPTFPVSPWVFGDQEDWPRLLLATSHMELIWYTKKRCWRITFFKWNASSNFWTFENYGTSFVQTRVSEYKKNCWGRKWLESNVWNSQRLLRVTLKFVTKILRSEKFAQGNLMSVAPALQNLRIGLKRRQSGKSKVPVKKRGSLPKVC